MIKHLRTQKHEKEWAEFLDMEKRTPSAKRPRLLSSTEGSTESPSKKLPDMGILSIQTKFGPSSIIQNERLLKIVTMLIKCMLPISLVENPSFREYIEYIDPSFHMPSVITVKERGLNILESQVNEAIKTRLRNMPWVNVSLDLWSDAILRPFNGFICQGKIIIIID